MISNSWIKLSFLLVQCVAAVLSASYYQKEYSGYLFSTPWFYDWETPMVTLAQSRCIQNGSKLLAITNSSIQNAVVAFINDAIQQNQLTGNNIITDGMREYGDWTWINKTTGTTLQLGGQDGGLPYSFGYLKTATSGVALNADLPTVNRCYICEGDVFCSNGYRTNNQCFQSFNNETLSWYEARNRCMVKGGDLATFEFITTNDALNSSNVSWLNPSTEYWIGMRREFWKWQSINSGVTYSQWTDGHPIYDTNQGCLCLLPNTPILDWKWSECQYNQVNQFICISSSGTPKTTHSPSTTSSSLISSSLSSSFANISAPQLSSQSTTKTTNATPNEDRNKSGGSQNESLAIGLGVGLGGGFLLLAIIIIVIILLSRKGIISFQRKRSIPKESPPPPYVTLSQSQNTIYAQVCTDPENKTSGSTSQDKNLTKETSTEYASLEIVQE